MKKTFIALLTLPFLASCGGKAPISSSSSSSSSTEEKITDDSDLILLKANINRFEKIDALSLSAENASLTYTFKTGVIQTLFGSPSWVPGLFSSEKSLLENAKSQKSTWSGLRSEKSKELAAEYHASGVTFEGKNITGSSLILSGKECALDAYSKEGTLYALPNGDAYSLLNYAVKKNLRNEGYDTSNFDLPENGMKYAIPDARLSEIDNSGFLPLSKRLPLLGKALLEEILGSDAKKETQSEIILGKRRFSFLADWTNPHEGIEKALDESLTGESLTRYEKELKPLFETIDSSKADLVLTYDAKGIQTLSLKGNVHFNEEKMKAHILEGEVEAGQNAIPLSYEFNLPIAFDLSEGQKVTYPDFSGYEEVVLPPKKEA